MSLPWGAHWGQTTSTNCDAQWDGLCDTEWEAYGHTDALQLVEFTVPGGSGTGLVITPHRDSSSFNGVRKTFDLDDVKTSHFSVTQAFAVRGGGTVDILGKAIFRDGSSEVVGVESSLRTVDALTTTNWRVEIPSGAVTVTWEYGANNASEAGADVVAILPCLWLACSGTPYEPDPEPDPTACPTGCPACEISCPDGIVINDCVNFAVGDECVTVQSCTCSNGGPEICDPANYQIMTQ